MERPGVTGKGTDCVGSEIPNRFSAAAHSAFSDCWLFLVFLLLLYFIFAFSRYHSAAQHICTGAYCMHASSHTRRFWFGWDGGVGKAKNDGWKGFACLFLGGLAACA